MSKDLIEQDLEKLDRTVSKPTIFSILINLVTHLIGFPILFGFSYLVLGNFDLTNSEIMIVAGILTGGYIVWYYEKSLYEHNLLINRLMDKLNNRD